MLAKPYRHRKQFYRSGVVQYVVEEAVICTQLKYLGVTEWVYVRMISRNAKRQMQGESPSVKDLKTYPEGRLGSNGRRFLKQYYCHVQISGVNSTNPLWLKSTDLLIISYVSSKDPR